MTFFASPTPGSLDRGAAGAPVGAELSQHDSAAARACAYNQAM